MATSELARAVARMINRQSDKEYWKEDQQRGKRFYRVPWELVPYENAVTSGSGNGNGHSNNIHENTNLTKVMLGNGRRELVERTPLEQPRSNDATETVIVDFGLTI